MTRNPLDRTATRRAFLAGAGLAVAAACSGGGDDSSGATTTTGGASSPPDALAGGMVTPDLITGEELRIPFGVIEPDGGALRDAPVTVGFTGPGGEAIAPRSATFRDAGLEGMEREGIYTTSATFPVSGFWSASVESEGREGGFEFEVRDEPLNPWVGDEAISTASPTADEPLGVDPICTREPICPFHEVSLDEALGGGPVVLLFGTPARCQSRWCGPVLEVLVNAAEENDQGLTFIHSEIFKDLTSADPTPTVEAWNLAFEPILYGIGTKGVIRQRLDGAFDRDEVDEFLAGVSA